MNKQIKLLSLLGIIPVIGVVSTLAVLATSCGNKENFNGNFNLFDDISVKNTYQAEKTMERVTWIWEHCSEYGYSDYGLYSTCIFFSSESGVIANDAFKDSIISRIGGNGSGYSLAVRSEFYSYLDDAELPYAPKEVSIWCELAYDLSWQYCNSINFKMNSFELKGFSNPENWCDVDGYGIGGTAWIKTTYASGMNIGGYVMDNFGELMDTKYVNGYFKDMNMSDDGDVYNKSFTCSWGTEMSMISDVSETRITMSFSQKLFGIGETGWSTFDSETGLVELTDLPTLYWFNTSFVLQNCIP